jgi:hypothetical protein
MHRFSPSLDLLEGRLTLSTLTTREYFDAKVDVQRAINLESVGHMKQAEQVLDNAAGLVPFGRADLLPEWKIQLAAITNGTPRSAIRQDIFLSLDSYLNHGIQTGAIKVTGPAAGQVSRPVVVGINPSIVVANLTGVGLEVTVTEQRSGRVALDINLSKGELTHFTPPPASIPSFSYEVEARLSAGATPVADITARPGDTVVFLDGPSSIEAEVFETGPD